MLLRQAPAQGTPLAKWRRRTLDDIHMDIFWAVFNAQFYIMVARVCFPFLVGVTAVQHPHPCDVLLMIGNCFPLFMQYTINHAEWYRYGMRRELFVGRELGCMVYTELVLLCFSLVRFYSGVSTFPRDVVTIDTMLDFVLLDLSLIVYYVFHGGSSESTYRLRRLLFGGKKHSVIPD